MPKRNVTVRTKLASGLIAVVRLDGTKLRLDANGMGNRDLEEDSTHAIDYIVRGQPGGTYSVAITAPKESRMSHAGTLDDDQLDVGHCYFYVGAGK